MFIGHFAVGFASKKFAPGTSMSILIAAPLFLDMLWPWFLLLGWEQVRINPGNTRFTPLDLVYYPWSHSFLISIVWATTFSLIYYLITHYWSGTVVIWIGVVSHWILDWITHRSDMPLYPAGPRFGLGLWNSISGTLGVELLMFAAGIWLYVSTTCPRDRIGHYAFVAYITLLLVTYIGNRFSRSPSSVGDLAWPGIIAEAILYSLGMVVRPSPCFTGWNWCNLALLIAGKRLTAQASPEAC